MTSERQWRGSFSRSAPNFVVVTEAYVHGVPTRKVDNLAKALTADSRIAKSEVSQICADLATEVGAFRDRSPDNGHRVCVLGVDHDPGRPLGGHRLKTSAQPILRECRASASASQR